MPSEFCAHTKWQICYKAYQGFNASIFILFKTMAKIEQWKERIKFILEPIHLGLHVGNLGNGVTTHRFY